jgi:hypothetical protein
MSCPYTPPERSVTDRWFQWLSTLLLPLVLVYLGHQFTTADTERSVQVKFVELALQILKEPPSDEKKDLRLWAIRIVDRYAGVPLSHEAAYDLLNRIPLSERSPAVSHELRHKPSESKTLKDFRREQQEWKCQHQASNMDYRYWKSICEK